MRQTVRLAIAGCGRVSCGLHLPNLRRQAGVEVVAVADPDDAATAAARRVVPRADRYRDWRDMLQHTHLDAVIVALPTELHGLAARTVLEAGLHLYLEKPLATGTEEGAPILEAWRASGRVGMIGFNYRFNPLFVSLRDSVRNGRLGSIVALRTQFTTTEPAPGWRASVANGGGVLLDLGSHHLDLLRHVCGSEIRHTSVHLASRRTEHDTASLFVELDNGAVAQCFFAFGICDEDSVEVIGERGRARVHRHASLAVELLNKDAASIRADQVRNALRAIGALPYMVRKTRAAGHEPSYALALQRFVAAVRGEAGEFPDLEDGFRALAAIEAARPDPHPYDAGPSNEPQVLA